MTVSSSTPVVFQIHRNPDSNVENSQKKSQPKDGPAKLSLRWAWLPLTPDHGRYVHGQQEGLESKARIQAARRCFMRAKRSSMLPAMRWIANPTASCVSGLLTLWYT